MRGLYGAALGGSYLVQAAVQGATHHTPRPPRTTTRAALQLLPRRRYLTVYSTVKGTLRTQKALRRSEEMDLFFLGPTTGQRAVCTVHVWNRLDLSFSSRYAANFADKNCQGQVSDYGERTVHESIQ